MKLPLIGIFIILSSLSQGISCKGLKARFSANVLKNKKLMKYLTSAGLDMGVSLADSYLSSQIIHNVTKQNHGGEWKLDYYDDKFSQIGLLFSIQQVDITQLQEDLETATQLA